MRGTGFIVGVGLALLVGAARAADAPVQTFAERMKGIRERVDIANRNVVSAVRARDWAAWERLHDAYAGELRRGQDAIESACSRLLIETLARGDPIDPATLEAMDLAAMQAANYARHRVVVSAWATVARQGVRSDKRGAALDLLERQGIYAPDAGAGGASSAWAGTVAGGDSPMAGRIPGNPEAAAHLQEWQTASMKANAAAQRIASLENELAALPADSPRRGDVERRLQIARTQYDVLVQEVEQTRRLYYQAGGR